MRRQMTAMLLAVAVLSAGCAMLPKVQPPPAHVEAGLVGQYDCKGVNAGGMAYEAVVDVVMHEGLLHMRWTFPDGGQMFAIGFVKDNRLTVGYYRSAPGVAVYFIEPGKPLTGAWIMAGSSGRYQETLTKRIGVAPDTEAAPSPEPIPAPAPRSRFRV